MYTLYYRPTCPFCQRVLQVAETLGVTFDLKDISEDETARTTLISLGGKQQVPFLVDTERNITMYESNDIIEHIRTHRTAAAQTAPARPRLHISDNACVSCEG